MPVNEDELPADLRRPFDLRNLTKQTTKGGAAAEKEYGDYHHRRGTQRLKAKYRGR